MDSWRLKLKLWGVRGSIPTPTPHNLGYGGNTACLEVRLPNNDLFIFDAGSGIRDLGLSMQTQNGESQKPVNLFLTHFHWDHIQGLPFFGPLYQPASAVTFYSSKFSGSLHDSLAGQMSDPYFPVKFDACSSKREFVDLGAKSIRIGALTVHPFPLKHPQGASGYRIESEGAVIVYATDREHGDAKLDSVLRDYTQDADILIHDAQYTLEEYSRYQGWGHSTWQEAVHVAQDGKVKKLILFHHDPAHDDQALSSILETTRHEFPDTLAACEGWVGTI